VASDDQEMRGGPVDSLRRSGPIHGRDNRPGGGARVELPLHVPTVQVCARPRYGRTTRRLGTKDPDPRARRVSRVDALGALTAE